MGHTFNIFLFVVFLLTRQYMNIESGMADSFVYLLLLTKAVYSGCEMLSCFKRVPARNGGFKTEKECRAKKKTEQIKTNPNQGFEQTSIFFFFVMHVSPRQQNKRGDK